MRPQGGCCRSTVAGLRSSGAAGATGFSCICARVPLCSRRMSFQARPLRRSRRRTAGRAMRGKGPQGCAACTLPRLRLGGSCSGRAASGGRRFHPLGPADGRRRRGRCRGNSRSFCPLGESIPCMGAAFRVGVEAKPAGPSALPGSGGAFPCQRARGVLFVYVSCVRGGSLSVRVAVVPVEFLYGGGA